jgi:hypothetical protein
VLALATLLIIRREEMIRDVFSVYQKPGSAGVVPDAWHPWRQRSPVFGKKYINSVLRHVHPASRRIIAKGLSANPG